MKCKKTPDSHVLVHDTMLCLLFDSLVWDTDTITCGCNTSGLQVSCQGLLRANEVTETWTVTIIWNGISQAGILSEPFLITFWLTSLVLSCALMTAALCNQTFFQIMLCNMNKCCALTHLTTSYSRGVYNQSQTQIEEWVSQLAFLRAVMTTC